MGPDDTSERIIGARESAAQEKLRERAETEKKLASFLFGNPASNAAKDIKLDESDNDSSESESSDDENSSDLDDEVDTIESDNEQSDHVIADNEGAIEETEDDSSDEDAEDKDLPSDTFGDVLQLKKGSRKRKAVWKDEDDSEVLVKDVTATYTKAVGKHGAKFSTNGEEFVVGSQHHGHFFVYDMMAGKIVKIPWHKKSAEHNTQKFEVSPDGKLIAVVGRFGNIFLISARTKELINTLKMNDECHSVAFSRSGDKHYGSY